MTEHAETFRQILSVLTVFSNELSQEVSNGAVNAINNDILLNGNEYYSTKWTTILSPIIGALISAKLLYITGRKILLSFSSTLNIISWFLIILTGSTFSSFLIPLVTGLSTGINDSVNSIYIGEISSPVHRSTFGFTLRAINRFGFLIGFLITSKYGQQTTAALIILILFILLPSIFYAPETPQYFLMKGKLLQAEENFAWLKGVKNSDDVAEEFSKLQQNVVDEVSKQHSYPYYTLLINRPHMKILFIIFKMTILAGSLGYNILVIYPGFIFRCSDLLSPNTLAVLLGFEIGWTVFALILTRIFNRKTILLGASLTVFLTQVFMTVLLYNELTGDHWYIYAALIMFYSGCSVIFAELFLARGELLPLSIKSYGNCLFTICSTIVNNLAIHLFISMTQEHDYRRNFLMFSANGFITILFVYFALPATGNKSLIEIQEKFK